jgi:hypothetical protein
MMDGGPELELLRPNQEASAGGNAFGSSIKLVLADTWAGSA